jgi:hypothetical protein
MFDRLFLFFVPRLTLGIVFSFDRSQCPYEYLSANSLKKAVPEKWRVSALKVVWQHIFDPAAVGRTDKILFSQLSFSFC